MPIFFSSGPRETPGLCRSTMKLEYWPSTRAKTMATSAKAPLVMNCFSPLIRTYLPFSTRRAVVLPLSASEPAPGSVRA